ncbi:MAG: tetraacyldisaccharide 4'-kinase [Pelosinus sp.]|nr:tetraacyldisaccharide 4'-kinase [Pelosinus sp.]
MRQMEAFQIYLYKIAHGEKKGFIAAIVLAVLRILSLIYGFGVGLKLSLYKHGFLRQHKLPCFVISLGNITVGGTGKTPTAQRLATIIRDMGYRVVILNRGYRSAWKGQVGVVSDGDKIYMSVTEAGDEAYLMAKKLPGVGVVIGKKRAITGNYAVDKLKAEVIILDDGYQHWELARDLDIVLIDTINVFGNNFLLPRGTLREPLANLERAHACLLTKVDQSTHDARDGIRDIIKCYNDTALIVESIHNPRYFIEIEEWYKGIRTKNMIPLDIVKGQKIVALSAIGNPPSFEQTITGVGAEVVETVRYPDHHDYTMAEMQHVMQKAVDNGAYAIITTEKDAVKIPSEFIHSDRPLRMYVLGIEIYFTEGHEELMDCINKKAQEVLHSGGK